MCRYLFNLFCLLACIGFSATPARAQVDAYFAPASSSEINDISFSDPEFSGASENSYEGSDLGSGIPFLSSQEAAAKAGKAHKGLFYKNDFSYLMDPAINDSFLGDAFKLAPVANGQLGTMDVGGQFRWRYHHEKGMGQTPGFTRFQNNTNDFHLSRLRLYSNWRINQDIRVYWEGIYAGLDTNSTYVPRPIDENYGDFLNLFVDIKLTDNGTLRVGRQELLYGAQRNVSPLDWANTRRTFEGIKWMHRSEEWSVDTFYTNFVPVVSNKFDEADYDRSFYGIYSVYKGIENLTLDFYYLGFDNQTVGAPITTDFSLHTIGSRMNGTFGDWLVELESAQQFGRQSGLGLDHTAMYYTGGIGRKLGDTAGAPTVWLYYDYASGDNIGGNFNRYNDLFPLGHKYLGFIDAVQRANIETPNLLVTAKPTEKTELLVWYYHFMSNQDTDIVPAIGGTPVPQSTSSKDFGDELDLMITFGLGPRSKFLLGWSHFWIGNKIQTPGRSDADFFYSQWHVNF